MGTSEDGHASSTVSANAQGVFCHWGSGMEAVFGHTSEQALGMSIDLIIPRSLHPWHWRGFDKALRTGELRKPNSTVRVPAVHRDGQLVAVKGEIRLTRDEDGNVNGAEVANIRMDSAWMASAWKPVVALIGLAGRAGMRPRTTSPEPGG
ncbi:MAG: PAS domain S-box protein [Marmoricola sp.]